MNSLFLPSTRNAAGALSSASLLLRLGLGILMIPHGYQKLTHFAEWKGSFMNFLGLSGSVSLSLVIFSELICSILLMLGLLTRAILIPLIITGLVIVFVAHEGDVFGEAATGTLFLLGYIALWLIGPGQYSLDNLLFRKSQ